MLCFLGKFSGLSPDGKEPTEKVKMQGEKGGMSKASNFVSDSMSELKKVTPPTRQETMQSTLVTLFIMIFIALSLALLDFVFNQIMSVILS